MGKVQDEFAKYKLDLIKEFVLIFMPPPVVSKCKFFKIKTLDGFDYCVWGVNKEDVLSQFQRFIKLRIFI